MFKRRNKFNVEKYFVNKIIVMNFWILVVNESIKYWMIYEYVNLILGFY